MKEIFSGISKAEKVMLGVCLIAIIICVYVLNQDDFFRSKEKKRTTFQIGKIAYLKNQVRHKTIWEPLWKDGFENQNVHIKDSIFNGENALSKVQLNEGGDVEIGPNSLVVFDKISDMNLADFRAGNYILKIKGKMNLAIQGNVTSFEGDGSEVQVVIKKSQKPQIRLIKGNAVFKEKHKPARKLEMNTVIDLEISPLARYVASTPTPEELEVEEKGLIFENPKIEQKQQNLRMYDVYDRVGQNLRLKPYKVYQHPYLKDKVQLFKTNTSDLVLKNKHASTVLRISSNCDFNGFAIDISTDIGFLPSKTRSYWTNKKNLRLDFNRSGHFFYRIHGVNQATEITAPTPALEIVVLPEPQVAGPLAKVQNEDINFKEKKENTSILKSSQITSTKKSTLKTKNNTSRPEDTVSTSSEDVTPLRASASVKDLNIIEKIPEPVENFSEDFALSLFEIQSGTMSTFSQEEKDVGRDKPILYSIGLRSKHWMGSHGFESSLKMKAKDGNDSAKGMDPLQLEGRYHYLLSRTILGPSATSVIGGYEFYRNVGRGFFSQEYDLFKLGLSYDRPLLSRWTLGAEALHGFNASQSRKFELQGRLFYYFRRKWSLGFAYRLHLFEAGDEKNAPFEMPYKESQSEGLFIIRWQY